MNDWCDLDWNRRSLGDGMATDLESKILPWIVTHEDPEGLLLGRATIAVAHSHIVVGSALIENHPNADQYLITQNRDRNANQRNN